MAARVWIWGLGLSSEAATRTKQHRAKAPCPSSYARCKHDICPQQNKGDVLWEEFFHNELVKECYTKCHNAMCNPP